MDPTAVPVHDDTTVAMIIGAVIAAIKVIEKGWEKWAASRRGKNGSNGVHTTVVQLDPAASAAIAQILTSVRNIEEVVDRRDGDGTPLVYFSRKDQNRLQDDVGEIHEGVRILLRGKSSS